MNLDYALLIVSILISLGFWGLIRTAVWVIPGLFFQDYFPLASVSLLSFYATASLLAPYQERSFDFRDWRKERWSLLFFLTGVLGASLLYPVPIIVFGFCSLFPLLCLQIFKIIRFPASEVLVFPYFVKFIAPALWLIFFIFNRL